MKIYCRENDMFGLIFWFFVISIFYTYLGYPMLLTLLARFRSKPKTNPATYPEVTLLIAAYNEEDVIKDKIENTLLLDYPKEKLQVIVAADGSDDGTAQIVQQYVSQGVELSHIPERQGKMAAINRAMTMARGDIVVLSDANNMFGRDAVSEMVKPFTDPSVGAVSGAKKIITDGNLLGESEGLYWKYESFIKEQETRLGTCTGAAAEILAIRREEFEPPPDYIINDDFYILMHIIKQGKRVIYAPGAHSFERVSSSPQGEITRRTRIIAGRYQAMTLSPRLLNWRRPLVVWQIVSHKFLRPLVPFAMIGALLANIGALIWQNPSQNPVIFLALPFNWLSLILQVLFYLLALAANIFKFKGKPGKILYIPAFLVNSNLAALVGFHRYITGRQTVLWDRVARQK